MSNRSPEMNDSDDPDTLAREAEIITAITAATINIISNRRSLAKGVVRNEVRFGWTNAIVLSKRMTGTLLRRERQLMVMLRSFIELDGDEPSIGPNHFAIALCATVLEPAKSKLIRQLRHRMCDGKARPIFGNIPNSAVNDWFSPSETHHRGASGRSTNGLTLCSTLVRHLSSPCFYWGQLLVRNL